MRRKISARYPRSRIGDQGSISLICKTSWNMDEFPFFTSHTTHMPLRYLMVGRKAKSLHMRRRRLLRRTWASRHRPRPWMPKIPTLTCLIFSNQITKYSNSAVRIFIAQYKSTIGFEGCTSQTPKPRNRPKIYLTTTTLQNEKLKPIFVIYDPTLVIGQIFGIFQTLFFWKLKFLLGRLGGLGVWPMHPTRSFPPPSGLRQETCTNMRTPTWE